MKFSEQWLREWVNPPLTTADLVSQITMAGLEVDGVEPVAASLSKVVVGEVLETSPHPNADKLQVCSCLLYTSPSPRDQRGSRMPSSA